MRHKVAMMRLASRRSEGYYVALKSEPQNAKFSRRPRGMDGMGLMRRWGWSKRAARAKAALAAVGTALLFLAAGMPFAAAEEPYDWQLGMMPGATPVRERIDA